MPLVLRPPGYAAPPLTERLRSLGRTRRLVRVLTGAFALVAWLGFVLALACVLDIAFNLHASLRAIGLLTLMIGSGVLFVRGIVRPSRESVRPLRIAHILESRFPSLNDALASAVSFQDRTETTRDRGENSFRRAAMKRAEHLTEDCDTQSIIPTGKLWRAFGLMFVGLLALGVVTIVTGNRAAHAGLRLFDPYGQHAWPPRTKLELLEPPTLLARGDSLTVQFRVRGEIPDDAAIHLRAANGSVQTERVPLVSEGDAANGRVVLGPDRVSETFEFQVTANDAASVWQRVEVVSPPKLMLLDGRPSPQIRLTFPLYTGLPSQDLPDGTGMVTGVSGTRIQLRAKTDRRIRTAVLHYQGDTSANQVAAAIAPIAATSPFAMFGSQLIADRFLEDIPLQIHGSEGQLLQADFAPPLNGIYALRFTDERGLTGTRLIEISTTPDPAPMVAIDKPRAGQDPLLLLPTAKLLVRTRADDRTFAVRQLNWEHRSGEEPYRVWPIIDAERNANTLQAVVGTVTATIRPQPQTLEDERVVAIAQFANAAGKPPADGDVIFLRAMATDWDDTSIDKAPGRSPEVEIRILSAESMKAWLQREIVALRPELARVRDLQLDANAKLNEAQKALPATDPLDRAEQTQRMARAPVADPRAGLKAKTERLRDVVRRNALPNSATTERVESLARTMEELDNRFMEAIEPEIANAKRTAGTPAANKAIEAAKKNQKAALDRLNAAIEDLEPWASANELRSDIRTLKNAIERTVADAAKQAERRPAGQAIDKLTPEDRAGVERSAAELEKAASDGAKAISKTERIAEEKRQQAAALTALADQKSRDAKSQPEASALREKAKQAEAEAKALDKAAETAGKRGLADDLRNAAEAQRRNRPGEAGVAAQKAVDRLEKMTKELSDEKAESVDELAKKRKQEGAEIDSLTAQQEELSKKITEAGAKADPTERAESLKKLAEEQNRLSENVEKLSRKLQREGATDSAEKLRKATENMQQARDELNEGRAPNEELNDALDRLDDAKQSLEAERTKDAEQLEREKREQLVEPLRAFLEKQKAAVAESERLTDMVAKAKKWERPVVASLSSVADQQKVLAAEVVRFAETKLEKQKVFERMLRQASENMAKAATRIEERKADALTADPLTFEPETERAADEDARRPMRLALRRLQQIVDSLKDPDKPKPPMAAAPPPKEGDAKPPPAEGAPPGDGLPPLAQLKALRDWQKEVNAMTEEFAKSHPDAEKWTEDEVAELKNLEQSQKEIAELFEQLAVQFQRTEEQP